MSESRAGKLGHCPGSVTPGPSALLGTSPASWFTWALTRSLMQSPNYKRGLSPGDSELGWEGFRAALLFPVSALQGGTWTCWQEFTGWLQIRTVLFENEPYDVRFKEVSLHVGDGSEVTWTPSELLWNWKIQAALWRFCSFFDFADSNIWKLKLGHLSLELRLGFPAERVTEVWIRPPGGGGLSFTCFTRA